MRSLARGGSRLMIFPFHWSLAMRNAHERFGTLEFTRRMKDTTTHIRLPCAILSIE